MSKAKSLSPSKRFTLNTEADSMFSNASNEYEELPSFLQENSARLPPSNHHKRHHHHNKRPSSPPSINNSQKKEMNGMTESDLSFDLPIFDVDKLNLHHHETSDWDFNEEETDLINKLKGKSEINPIQPPKPPPILKENSTASKSDRGIKKPSSSSSHHSPSAQEEEWPSFLKDLEESKRQQTLETLSKDLKLNQEIALQLYKDKDDFESYKKTELQKLKGFKSQKEEELKRELEEVKGQLKEIQIKQTTLVEKYQTEVKSLKTMLKSKNDQLERLLLGQGKRPDREKEMDVEANKSFHSTLPSASIWSRLKNYKFHVVNLHDYTKEEILPEGTHERSYPNGIKIILYANGAAKEIMPKTNTNMEDSIDISLLGHTLYYFPNGHIKNVFPNGDVVYFYGDSGITCHVFASDGLRRYTFPSGQIENYYGSRVNPNESILSGGSALNVLAHKSPFIYHEIIYPDGTTHQKMSNGKEIIKYKDETIVHIDQSGKKTIILNNAPSQFVPNSSSKLT